jgi:hypothetical protein
MRVNKHTHIEVLELLGYCSEFNCAESLKIVQLSMRQALL